MTDKEAMKLALDALELAHPRFGIATEKYKQAITALKERLAQENALQALHNENERLGLYKDAYAEQEPAAQYSDIVSDGGLDPRNKFDAPPQRTEQEPVIDKSAAVRIATALGWEPKREWVGLTDEEIEAIWYAFHDREMGYAMRFTRAIEAKLKEKNT